MKSDLAMLVAIPVFLLSIGVEVLWARRRGLPFYRRDDSIANLGCGVLQQVAAILFAGFFLELYARLYALAPRPLPASSPWTWAFALLGVDLLYYWWHRLSHQVNFLWAVHIVHHQSEEYNLSVALRQASFSMATSIPFYAPLALLGVPPGVFVASSTISTFYQFWIHTRAIGRLGSAERLLNTPSHHRVHHGRNPKYIDKNFGAILISWDRLFGTFQEEHEEPSYGIKEPFRSHSAVWANFHYWRDLVVLTRQAKESREKALVWLMYPGWKPSGVAAASSPTAPPLLPRYALPLLAGAIAGLTAMFWMNSWAAPWLLRGMGAAVLLMVWAIP